MVPKGPICAWLSSAASGFRRMLLFLLEAGRGRQNGGQLSPLITPPISLTRSFSILLSRAVRDGLGWAGLALSVRVQEREMEEKHKVIDNKVPLIVCTTQKRNHAWK